MEPNETGPVPEGMPATAARHQASGEGNLHDLSDDDYFEALAEMPKVFDADGNEVVGLFGDVQDRREEKRLAAERGEEFSP